MIIHNDVSKNLERVMGVGPISQPWEGYIIPIYYTRKKMNNELGIMNNGFFIYYIGSKKTPLILTA